MKKLRKPQLGQHFLTSEGALFDMVESGDVQTDDTILEIGPGKGVLTKKLLEKIDPKKNGKVIAIEKDNGLVSIIQAVFADEIQKGSLELIEGDILSVKIDELFTKKEVGEYMGDEKKELKYKIIANIPYYITGEIIRLFLTHTHKPTSMTLLVQKEVAERIVAKDGKESVLSLSVKFFGTPRLVSTVKKGSFNPPPRVDSAIIHIGNISPREGFDDRGSEFFTLIKAGFQSKRKKVLSNISLIHDREKVLGVFKKLKLDENTRAEDIHIDTWLNILKELA